MSDAPVCHIVQQLPGAEPQTARLPAIPIATDLPSALAAIAALRQIVHSITGQLPNLGTAKTQPVLKEILNKRTTETVRVKNPQDNSQFVDVEQINHLEFQDASSGQKLIWNRPASR